MAACSSAVAALAMTAPAYRQSAADEADAQVPNTASVSYLFANGKYSIRVYGKNLTNKAYATQMNSQDVGDSIGMAPGRTYGVTLGAKF